MFTLFVIVADVSFLLLTFFLFAIFIRVKKCKENLRYFKVYFLLTAEYQKKEQEVHKVLIAPLSPETLM